MKNVFKQIFLWIEMIVAARILLFVMPVMIAQRFTGLYGPTVDDLFMTLLGLVGFYGFILGFLGLRGFRAAAWMHGLIGAFLLLAAVAFLFGLKQAGESWHAVHALPLALAAVMTIGFVLMRANKEPQS